MRTTCGHCRRAVKLTDNGAGQSVGRCRCTKRYSMTTVKLQHDTRTARVNGVTELVLGVRP